MSSTWGKRHGLPGYDQFRINMTYDEAYAHLATSKKHRYRRKGSVLGYMHEVKLQLYNQAVDRGYLEQLEMEAALKLSQRKTSRKASKSARRKVSDRPAVRRKAA